MSWVLPLNAASRTGENQVNQSGKACWLPAAGVSSAWRPADNSAGDCPVGFWMQTGFLAAAGGRSRGGGERPQPGVDGTAERATADIRREATARAQLARDILGADRVVAPDGSLHGWLTLPPSWTVAAFVALSQQRGVRVTPADWYVTSPSESFRAPTAVRFTLGAEQDRRRIEHALRTLASILAQPAGSRTSI